MMSRGSEPQSSILSVHHQYSSRVSPFQANTAAESRATAAAAWSWVEKMLHEHQRTTAPSATRVSMSTAVWMVMWSEPEMFAPLRGWAGPNSLIMDMRPGISTCASSISRRLSTEFRDTARGQRRKEASRLGGVGENSRACASVVRSRARSHRSRAVEPDGSSHESVEAAAGEGRRSGGWRDRDVLRFFPLSGASAYAPEVGHGHVLDLVLATVEGLDVAHSSRGRHLC